LALIAAEPALNGPDYRGRELAARDLSSPTREAQPAGATGLAHFPDVEAKMKTPLVLASMLLCSAVASALSGQTASVRASMRNADSARAEALYVRAAAMFDRPARYRHAARLLVQSAQLRDPADRMAFTSLWKAGRLYSYAEDRKSAQRTLTRAGELALGNGELLLAANALLDAAMVAAERRDAGGLRLVDRAQILARSPHLTASERQAILSRIVPARHAFAAAAARR
jgi:hypothetical protein